MTDHIPADKVRKIVNDMRRHADHDAVRGREEEYVGQFADLLEALLPDPPRPTLADMTEEERAACKWMQCDVETWGRAVIVLPNERGGRTVTLNQRGHMAYENHTDVTPRPDLPRLEWPGDTPTGPDHLAVGTVIESADDPRLAALPDGSVLLDCDGETVAKRHGEWVGIGYIPIPSEGGEFGPWTVLHIPKEDGQ